MKTFVIACSACACRESEDLSSAVPASRADRYVTEPRSWNSPASPAGVAPGVRVRLRRAETGARPGSGLPDSVARPNSRAQTSRVRGRPRHDVRTAAVKPQRPAPPSAVLGIGYMAAADADVRVLQEGEIDAPMPAHHTYGMRRCFTLRMYSE